MKKLIAIFFLLIYSFTTVGTTIHSHYCMGQYVGSSICHTEDSKCAKCGMKTAKSKGCCTDQEKYIQLKREHHQSIAPIEIQHFFTEATITSNFYFYTNCSTQNCSIKNVLLRPPPLINSIKLHLLNCVFLI